MNKKILVLIIFVIAVIAVYFGFVKKKPVEVATAPQALGTFSNSYIAGYEGDFQSIDYSLSYPKNDFSLSSRIIDPSIINIKELSTGKMSFIKIFYNGAAGFSSAKDLWKNQFQQQCPDCAQTNNSFSYLSSDIATFQNATDTWIIFSRIPGFVVSDLKKPSSELEKILSSISISVSKSSAPEFSLIKIYFADSKNQNTNCDKTIASERQIIKTPKIAQAAIETLLDGPNTQEKESGLTTAIPAGSELNSVSITNGTAFADFNQTTESGGGSCSMTQRIAQIKQTLLQFPTIQKVTLSIDGKTESIFQP